MNPLERIIERLKRLVGQGRVEAPVDDEIEAAGAPLREEIRELKKHLHEANNELYALSTSYSSRHFKLYTALSARKIEGYREAGAAADAQFLAKRCAELEQTIADLRFAIAAAGHDPDAAADDTSQWGNGLHGR